MRARLPQGMGGGPQNMNQMIKQAQKMQEEMKAKQEELEQQEFKTTSGGGMVEVTITGKKEIKDISNSEMEKITGALNIPGVF